MDLISPEEIRIKGSTATELNAINAELLSSLFDAVMSFIEEAQHKLSVYQESKAQFDKQIKELRNELENLKTEKNQAGFFAFAKKKEIALAIENKEKQISEFERTHESKILWVDFKNMYR